MNVAHWHIEKAESLKTTKSRLKYLTLAQEVLEEGLTLDKDNADLHQALAHVCQMHESMGTD